MIYNSSIKRAGRFAIAMFLAIAVGFSPVFTIDAKAASQGQDVEPQADSWRYSGGEIIAEDDYNAQMGSQDEEKVEGLNTFSVSGGEAEELTEESDISLEAQASDVLYGVDVSYWQKGIDWGKVKAAGIDFAIIRCGYGANSTSNDDSYFRKNVNGCVAAGIPYGVYLYSYANTTAGAVNEAEHALRLLDGLHPNLPVYYDLEDKSVAKASNSTIQAMGRTFCSRLTTEGYRAGIYANLSWWNNKLGNGIEGYSKWVAQWNDTCSYSGTNKHIWQYTSSATVSGISGRVDKNKMFSKAAMDSFMSGAYTVAEGDIQDVNDFVGYANQNVTSKKGPGRAYYNSDVFSYCDKVTVTRQYGSYYEITKADIEEAQAGSGCWVVKSAISLPTDPMGFSDDPEQVLMSFNGNVIKNSGFTNVSGKLYFIDENGHALKGWQNTETLGNNDYYFDEKTGQVSSNTPKNINGRTYYLGKNGIISKNVTVNYDGYVRGFGSDGIMVTGRAAWLGYKCYTFDSQGRAYIKKAKTKRKVTVYAKPGSGKKGTLKRNKKFYALRTSGKYSQMANGLWVKTSYTKKTAVYPIVKPSVNSRYKTKMKKKARSYSGPSTSYIKKKILRKNKKVTVVGTYGNWAKLTTGYWVPRSKLR